MENIKKRADVTLSDPNPASIRLSSIFSSFFPFHFGASQLDIRPYDNYCGCQLWYLPSGSSGTGFPGISSLIIAELESSLLSQQRQGNTTVSPSLFVTVTSSTNMVRPRPYPSSPMRSLVIYNTWRKYLGYDISRSRKIFEGTNFYLRNLFTRNRANSVTVPITLVRTNFCQFQHWNGFYFNQRRVPGLQAFTAQTVQTLLASGVYTSPRKSGTIPVKNIDLFWSRQNAVQNLARFRGSSVNERRICASFCPFKFVRTQVNGV